MSESSQTRLTLDELQELPTVTSDLEDPPCHAGIYLLFSDDQCLYVGQSGRIAMRLKHHKKTQKWWPDVTRLETIGPLTDEDGRLTRETLEIFRHRPRYNKLIYLGLTNEGRIYPARF